MGVNLPYNYWSGPQSRVEPGVGNPLSDGGLRARIVHYIAIQWPDTDHLPNRDTARRDTATIIHRDKATTIRNGVCLIIIAIERDRTLLGIQLRAMSSKVVRPVGTGYTSSHSLIRDSR